jgi:peptidoglycan/LPS O-acetylase OafA/YrhL
MADELETFLQANSNAPDRALERRLANERRLQTRSRRVRWALRIAILALGLPGVLLLYYGADRQGPMAAIGMLLLLPILPLAIALFFMGGLAPGFARRRLSARQRQMLDD